VKTFALLLGLAGLAAAQAAPASRTFTGAVTDGMCERGDHSRMRMGPTDAECTTACVEEHDAAFVLFDGRNVYGLSDQKAPAAFAGRTVTVSGTLDAKTKIIHVESIAAAK
jgi:hypothetical protein